MFEEKYWCLSCNLPYSLIEVNLGLFHPLRYACIQGIKIEYCPQKAPRLCPSCGKAGELRGIIAR